MPGAQQEPMLIRPPATWDAESAETILTTVAELFSAGAATPLPLAEYLAPSPSIPVPTGENLGTVYSDPTVFTDSEVLNATQQACFINDLSALFAPDPSIALTRYGFTLPLRRDILTALSPDGRQSIASYNQAVSDSAARMSGSRGTLGELRSAVNLIPPGNVYTRTSPSSPLLIVAQNGMPLPVDTAILYTAPEGARLNVPASLRIPARGSVTVQMTADLPQEARGTDLQLYLAGPQGHAISQPVEISVRTPSSAVQGWVLIATGAVGFALLLLYSVGKRYRRNAAARAQSPPQEAAHLPTRSKTTRPANARKRSNGQRRDSAG